MTWRERAEKLSKSHITDYGEYNYCSELSFIKGFEAGRKDARDEAKEHSDKLEAKLKIAVDALKYILGTAPYNSMNEPNKLTAHRAIETIKELQEK